MMLIWKYTTFAIGLALLFIGRYYYQAPDWDIPISIIMATFAFLTAGWAMDVVLLHQWRKLPLVLLAVWWTVDGCYWLYWSLVDPSALVMRSANFGASLALYAMCGLVWSKEIFNTLAGYLKNICYTLQTNAGKASSVTKEKV